MAPIPKWTKAQLLKAIDACSNKGLPIRQASREFNIPYGTLTDKLSNRRPINPAELTVLSTEEEDKIVEWLLQMSARGFGRTRGDLFETIKLYLDQTGRVTKFKDNRPSKTWFKSFRERHPQIVFRTPQKLGKQRSFVTEDRLKEWFNKMKEDIVNIDPTLFLEPDRVYNADESGFALDAQSGKVLSFLGTRNVYQISNDNRTQITVLVCANVSGDFIHPLIIYPGKVFRGFKPDDVFSDSLIAKSINGWINSELFALWLEKAFIPQTMHLKKPILLFVDGHASHASMQASKLCNQNDIILYCLPAHASHITQPLDVGFFSTLKAKWTEAVRQRSTTDILTKRSFAGVFKAVYDESKSNKTLMRNGFRKSGLFPFDFNAIDKTKLIPSSNPVDQHDTASVSEQSSTTQLTLTLQHKEAQNKQPTEPLAPETHTQCGETTNEQQEKPESSSSSGEDNTLRKLVILTSQLGEETVALYLRRLEEGYDLGIDKQYVLWKTYFTDIDKQMKGAKQQPAKSPFALPTRQTKSSIQTKARKLNDPLISGKSFIEHLERVEAEKLEELRKKEDRKLMMLRKREEKAKEAEEKKRKREEKRTEMELKRKEKEANVLKRKLEKQKNKNDKKETKKQKIVRKLYESDDDTSVSGTFSLNDDESVDLEDVLMKDLEMQQIELDLMNWHDQELEDVRPDQEIEDISVPPEQSQSLQITPVSTEQQPSLNPREQLQLQEDNEKDRSGRYGSRGGGGGYDDNRYGRRDDYGRQNNGYDRGGPRSRDGSRDGGFDRDSRSYGNDRDYDRGQGSRYGGSRGGGGGYDDRGYGRRDDYGRGGRQDDGSDRRPRSRDGSLEHRSEAPRERPVLKLQPRTKPGENKENQPEPVGGAAQRASSIFGSAKPVDTYAKEKEIEAKLKKKETDREEPRREDSTRDRRSGEEGPDRRRKSSSGSGIEWTRNVLPVQKPPPSLGRRASEEAPLSPTENPKSPTSPKPSDSQESAKMVPAPPPKENAWARKREGAGPPSSTAAAPAPSGGRDVSNNAAAASSSHPGSSAGQRRDDRREDRRPPAGRGNRQGSDHRGDRDNKDRKPGGARGNSDGSGGDQQQLKKHQREKKLPKSIDEMPKFEEDRSRDFSTVNKYSFLMDDENDIGGNDDDDNNDNRNREDEKAPLS